MLAEAALCAPMHPLPYRVVDAVRETADVVTLTVEPVSGAPITAEPGQFNMLWAFGIGEVPISISGFRADGRLVHTIRSVGTVSDALARLAPGGTFGLRGPFGRGWRVDDAATSDVVIVAGGIGLAPLRPVVEHVLEHRDAFGRAALLVGARRPGDLVFRDQLAAWQAAADLDVEVVVDAAGSDWHGHVGVVPELVARAGFDPDRAVAFVCGPEAMMRFTARALRERGVAPERILLSAERNMHCAIAQCGHCQLGDVFVCREGPVFDAATLLPLLAERGR